jgi:hypothetical protein
MFKTIHNFLGWYKTRPTNSKSMIASCLTYLGVVILFFIVRLVIADRSTELMHPYMASNGELATYIDSVKLPRLPTDNYYKIFHLQKDIVSKRRDHHYGVAMTFFRNYYSASFCMIVISCLGGLILFVLINRGWAQSPYTLKVIFLTLASCAVFLTLFTNVFNHQKNFEDNMLRFMDYTRAELIMAEKMSELTKQDFPKKWVKPGMTDSFQVNDTMAYLNSLDTLVARNNVTINNLSSYLLSIDVSKLRNMNDVYQNLLDLKNIGKMDTTRSR